MQRPFAMGKSGSSYTGEGTTNLRQHQQKTTTTTDGQHRHALEKDRVEVMTAGERKARGATDARVLVTAVGAARVPRAATARRVTLCTTQHTPGEHERVHRGHTSSTTQAPRTRNMLETRPVQVGRNDWRRLRRRIG